MSKYTEGVCDDGAAILKDGVMMTIEQILAELNEKFGDGICESKIGKLWTAEEIEQNRKDAEKVSLLIGWGV